MIELAEGDLLRADVEALVNTVNCVGVMGKGIALQFKSAYPANFKAYAAACKRGDVQPGRMFVYEEGEGAARRVLINFPTKRHYRDASRVEDIEAGLVALAHEIAERGIRSIAVPPLGCGLGGLAWSDVEPRIRRALAAVPGTRVLLFAPSEAAPEAATVAKPSASITRPRAMLLALLDSYLAGEYGATRVELQKLSYFLQQAGEPMKLDFVKHQFGPYAPNLEHALRNMDGTLLRGVSTRATRAQIAPLPGVSGDVDRAISSLDDDARGRLERVRAVIAGFETPYGMELLASVHWVASYELPPGADGDAVVEAVHGWTDRKRRVMQAAHIRKAHERLLEQGWLPAAVAVGA